MDRDIIIVEHINIIKKVDDSKKSWFGKIDTLIKNIRVNKIRREKIKSIFNIQFMRIKRFNESLDEFIINSITFNNSKGIEKIIYPSVLVDFSRTSAKLKDDIRREMNELMWNQGFFTPPKFINTDTGDIIDDRLRYTVTNLKWVFFVEEKNLEKAKEIANKYGVEFYKNK